MRITFDGEHRSGKGTQTELYKKHVGEDLLTVRGDGSYQGGLEGIVSDEELAFRHHLNEQLFSNGTPVLWDIAATACARVLVRDEVAGKNLLIDRGPLSRAAFLISNGVPKEYISQQLYPEFTYTMGDTVLHQPAIDAESIDFGKIVYLRVPKEILLSRISDTDPKGAFRRANILKKEGLFDRALDSLSPSMQDTVVVIDGSQAPEDVLANYTT